MWPRSLSYLFAPQPPSSMVLRPATEATADDEDIFPLPAISLGCASRGAPVMDLAPPIVPAVMEVEDEVDEPGCIARGMALPLSC